MATTTHDPNAVYLGGSRIQVNELKATEAITPGMLIQRASTGWKKADTAKEPGSTFATEQSMQNKGVDDAYASGDLVEASVGQKGSVFWAIVASGANITKGGRLENAGNGYLRAWTDAAQAFEALETVDNSAGPSTARIRVEVL